MNEELSRQLRSLTSRLPTRDLAAATVGRYRRRRRHTLAAAAVAVLVAAVGTWAAVDAYSGTGTSGNVPPPAASEGPTVSTTAEDLTLGGAFYYYRQLEGREQVWEWVPGQEPQLLAEVGEPDDLAWEHYAWTSMAIARGGDQVAWVPRDGRVAVVDAGSGERTYHDVGGADYGCFPPAWHPDGTALLIHYGQDESGWVDVASGEVTAVGIDLSQACAATVFTPGEGGAVAVAFEDRSTNSLVALTEQGKELWRIDMRDLEDRLDPDEELWRLVDVADDGGYACVDIQREVVAGPGGGRSPSGNIVVDTDTAEVVADSRPHTGLCTDTIADGYLRRIDENEPGDNVEQRHQLLKLTRYDGSDSATLEEPVQLYNQSQLIGHGSPRAGDANQ